ncbi:YihY/virulence factor BrkB family protein [Aestuariibacter sp. A3R04]|uniref:YihY/virulence factor BrkB family protein n=1 Tax=Aestuariibacter sp. A3R04 TaxID=2841571 RepID=UPI001C09EBB1|nr:YihY/virulence factor BrkB family protein [Aestuariibacter sp. A3R04]MBU3021360.1 YihY/virulence factor BrkB family protein [Aestuariibacter sp. A3R04]
MSKTTFNNAKSTLTIPVKGWWSIAKRITRSVQNDNIPLIAAGVAFYCLLAIFPLLAATIALYGLVVSSAEVQEHMAMLVNIVPEESQYIIEEQLKRLIQRSNSALGWSFFLTLLISLWSSSKGANALITACNITYRESEGRGFFKGIVARIICTISMIATVIVALVCISVVPKLVEWLNRDTLGDVKVSWFTWPALLAIFNLALASLYRYAPHRRAARWRWVTPGSAFATILWVGASYGFSLYLTEFASYNKTYGSVGGIIILLLWLYLSAYIILIGAELNAAIELQTLTDSTVGKDKPMGERNAVVADNAPEDLQKNN